MSCPVLCVLSLARLIKMDGFESKSWRKEWKPLSRLREYEEEQKVPLAERISERDADS